MSIVDSVEVSLSSLFLFDSKGFCLVGYDYFAFALAVVTIRVFRLQF